METQNFFHPTMAGIFFNNNDKKLYKTEDNGDIHPVVLSTIVNCKNTKGFFWKSRLISLYRTIYECYNNIVVTDLGMVVSYRETVLIPDDFNPADLILITKSEWMTKRYAIGNMDETKAKVSKYLKDHSKEWMQKAVINIDTGEEFLSAKIASLSLGQSETAVAHSIRYNHKAGGYTFKYKDAEYQAKVDAKRKDLVPLSHGVYIPVKQRTSKVGVK